MYINIYRYIYLHALRIGTFFKHHTNDDVAHPDPEEEPNEQKQTTICSPSQVAVSLI